jgi:hypothetical protein
MLRESYLFQFVATYHLSSLAVLFCLLGLSHALDFAVHLWFRFLANLNESYYSYKARCVENRHRYEQVAGESARALSHRAGGTKVCRVRTSRTG